MKEKDSYDKYIEDLLGTGDFANVHPKDQDEIKQVFALSTDTLDYVTDVRVFPLKDKEKFNAIRDRGCCGSWNSQYKCRSGRIYLLGCNYGH